MLETHEITTGPEPRTTLIVLHGLGADGHDFVPICGELDLKAVGAVRYVFPHAPQRAVTINGGYVMRAWYDILGTDLVRREDEAGLRESQAAIAALVDRERERGIAAARIVLMGFSQGCAMALMTALRYPERLGGAVVPPARGLASRDALRALGHEVEWRDYPMPHSVCMEEIADLNAWLLKQLG
jgi:phospholipase/carboxylesterase